MHRGVLMAALLGLSTGALAQAAGSLTGIVVDAATQAPLADATVTAHSPALLGEQSAVTDKDGSFEMTLLPPGTYGLSVKRDGYTPFAPEGLVLKGKKVRVKLSITVVPVAVAAPSGPRETAVEFNDSTMTPPSMISGPNPEYSQDAVDRGVEGPMSVRCVVTAEGKVRSCKVLKGLPFMNQPVIDALERRKYKPAMASGKAVDVFYTFNLRLKLPQ
jgi:TonB family protein